MALSVADLDQYKARGVPAGSDPNERTFYSPIDSVHEAILAVLKSARHSLVIGMYGYDDDEFAAVIHAALEDKSMFVQISLDKSQAGGVHERAILDKYGYANGAFGNSVAIGTSEKGAIMHRKMVLVDGLWVIKGSTNWSTAGETKQDNECTIRYDAVAATEARTVMDIEHHKMLAALAA